MFRRQPPSPEFTGFGPAVMAQRTSKVRPLALVCVVLSAAIILMLAFPAKRAISVSPNAITAVAPRVVPGKTAPLKTDAPQSIAATQTPQVAPDAPPKVAPQAIEVARARTTLVGVPALSDETPVSQLLRRPIRLSQRSQQRDTLPNLTRAALQSLDANDQRLARIVHQALANGKSNTYIDALLNASLVRGDISVPATLLNARGDLDTPVLLRAILDVAGI